MAGSPPERNGHIPPKPTSAGTYTKVLNDFVDGHLAELTGSEVKVYLILSRHADNASGECRLAMRTIRQKAGLSFTAISKAILALEERQLVAVTRQRSPEGYKRASHYRIIRPVPPRGAPLSGARGAPLSGARGAPLSGARGAPLSGAQLDYKELNSLNYPPTPQGIGESAFEQFWEAYPRKQKKVAARREWQRLSPDAEMVRAIVASVARQKVSTEWQREEGRYIPCPDNWLRDRRWEDEPDGTRESPENRAEHMARKRAEQKARYGTKD